MTVEPDQSIVQSIAQLWREMGSVGGKLDSLQADKVCQDLMVGPYYRGPIPPQFNADGTPFA